MDALAGLLDGPRARGAFLLRVVMQPPWCVRVLDESPLTVIAVVGGDTWIFDDEHRPLHLRAGDVAVVRGPVPYSIADDPGTSPIAVIHPGQRCETPDGAPLHEAMGLGVRTWGNDPDGTTDLLIGAYELESAVGDRLLAVLPPLVVIPGDTLETPLVALLREEVVKDEPGQSSVLDRLLDLLLIAVLRAWFARPDAPAPRWYRANADPVVGRALRLVHNSPDHPWTVASLAKAAGSSRSGLARRFNELVGEPPMAYLTSWRLALAADLLAEPGTTIGSVARQVGYATPYALSAAFKRVRGVSPRDHRLALAG
jgi:AraC-like DNA-binding protein